MAAVFGVMLFLANMDLLGIEIVRAPMRKFEFWIASRLFTTISKLDPSNNTITPQKLFTNFYDKDFLYKLNSDAKGTQEIELTPIDKSKLFHKVIVYINKATKTITSTKVFEKAGLSTA